MEEHKKKVSWRTLGGVMILSLCVCGYLAFDMVFPMAKASPDLGAVLSYEISFDGEEVPLDESELTLLLSQLKEAKPTRRQSSNDRPVIDQYYKINLEVAETPESRWVYVYHQDGAVYYEIPYGGIYETDEVVWSLLAGEV